MIDELNDEYISRVTMFTIITWCVIGLGIVLFVVGAAYFCKTELI